MKLKIFSLLIAVLMSTAVLTSCSKAPAGAESSGGSSDNLSTEQGSEPSASGAQSGESGAQNGAQNENYDTDRIDELIRIAFSVSGIQISGSTNFCFTSPDDIKPEGFMNCFYSFEGADRFYDKASEKFVFTTDDVQNFLNKNFYNAVFHPKKISSSLDVYAPENDGYTYVKSEFCGLDSIKQNIIISEITESGEFVKATFALGELDNPESAVPPYYVLTVRKSGENYLICSLAEQGGEPSASESAAESVRFSCSVAADKTVTCALSLPSDIAFLPDSVGGELNKGGEKIGEISILPESDGHEAWAKLIRSLEQKTIGEYEFYVDFYETALVEEDEGGNKQLKKYIIYEYCLCDGGIWYSFTFLQRVSPQIVTLEECENILSTFQIEQP